jgi:hypothetical protein
MKKIVVYRILFEDIILEKFKDQYKIVLRKCIHWRHEKKEMHMVASACM